MVLVGLAIGFRPTEPLQSSDSAVLLMLGFSYVFSWVSAFIGLAVRDAETAQSAGMVWVIPLTFRVIGVRARGLDARSAR